MRRGQERALGVVERKIARFRDKESAARRVGRLVGLARRLAERFFNLTRVEDVQGRERGVGLGDFRARVVEERVDDLDDPTFVVGTDPRVDVRIAPRKLGSVGDDRAARDDEPPDIARRLLFERLFNVFLRLLPRRAKEPSRVNQKEIDRVGVCRLVARRLEPTRHRLGVDEIFGASERGNGSFDRMTRVRRFKV